MGEATVVVAIEGARLGEPWPGQTWSRRAVEELQEDPAVTVAEVNGKLVATKTLAAPVQRWEYVEVRSDGPGQPAMRYYPHDGGAIRSHTRRERVDTVVMDLLHHGWEPCGIASSSAGLVRAFRRRVQ